MLWKRVLSKTNLNASKNVLRMRAAVNRVTFTWKRTMLFVSWTTKLDWWKQLISKREEDLLTTFSCLHEFPVTRSRVFTLWLLEIYIFLFVCLFVLTFSIKFERQNTISWCLLFTLSSIFISSEEMNWQINFAVKQWDSLNSISSIYFPCLSI